MTDAFADWFSVTSVVRLVAMLFLAITFMEAGFDKVINFRSNKAYFQEHFEKSALKKSTSALFIVVMVMEISTGILSVIGAVFILLGQTDVAFGALVLATITFLSLYAGQRFAKDFVGAAGLVPYLIFTMLSMYLFI